MLSLISVIACACCDGARGEDDTDYRQRERVVTWPGKWQQDLAQCQGAALSVRTLRTHVCALHQRCEADTYDDDVQVCLEKRGYKVQVLK